jgi:hypothetical protein
MRKALTVTAAIVAAVVLFLLVTRPPAPASTAPAAPADIGQRTVRGAYHVHTSTSDGTADRQQIARAAARAGLRFVIFTDHGDGTRPFSPPEYIENVLCLDGVEISTNGGHYVALDMRSAPFPLGGEPSAVVEDVRRLGGFGIAAHPSSPKTGLAWSDWTATFDGLEWLNGDSEWRDESKRRLARAAIYYPFRPAGALASLLDRPVELLSRWDSIASLRPVVGLPAHDAHGGLISREDDGSRRPSVVRIPSYRASFRTFSVHAVLDAALTGSAPADGRAVLDAVRRGRVFTVIDALAGPAWLDFRADRGDTQATMGDALVFESEVRLTVRTAMPPGGQLVLICGGSSVGSSATGELSRAVSAPGACRPEVHAPAAPGTPPVPWILANPIYLLPVVAEPVGVEPLVETALALSDVDWLVEKEPTSTATVVKEGNGFVLNYQLGTGVRASQYVAAVASLRPPLPPYERILFTSSADAPMRVSVQLRFSGEERWVHSVYVEPDPRRVSLRLTDFVPAGRASSTPPDFRNASSLLFVIDLTNANPGTAGRIQVTDVVLGRPLPLGR